MDEFEKVCDIWSVFFLWYFEFIVRVNNIVDLLCKLVK